jgi:DNA/RNA endonuclease YhcR with UshA esterase domain
MIQGKIIGISGTIELREGKPEINVVSADQIKGLDSELAQ